MASELPLLFFGASEFAVPALRALVASGRPIRAVYTQPDRPAGRGRKLRPAPVALAARELSLPLEQPERLRGEAIEGIRSYEPGAVVLAAYGLLIPRAALEIPPLGWLNVHPSLLPKYRGASPVVAPILAGDERTGVSIFLMREGLDDGPVLSQVETPIGPAETAGELTARLAETGARLLVETLEAWATGGIEPREQDATAATYAPKLRREEALLDWTLPADVLSRRVRAYNPWPVAHTHWGDRLLRVLRAAPVERTQAAEPGAMYRDPAYRYPLVACGEGALALEEVQFAGAKRVDGKAFLAGRADLAGARLG